MARALASHHSMAQALWTEKILAEFCEGIQSLIINISLDIFCKQLSFLVPRKHLSHLWNVNEWMCLCVKKMQKKHIQRRECMKLDLSMVGY